MENSKRIILAALGVGIGIAGLGFLTGCFGVVLCLYTTVGGIAAGAAAVIGLCFLVDLLRKKLRGKGLKTGVFLLFAYVPSAVTCAVLWVVYNSTKNSGVLFAGLGEGLTALGCSIAYGLFLFCGLSMIAVEVVKRDSQKSGQ